MLSWKDFDYAKWEEENAKFDHESYDKIIQVFFDEAIKNKNISDLAKIPDNLEKPPWKPNAWYNEPGDQIEVWIDTEHPTYNKWLCPGVSLALTQEGNEIAGITICGIKRIIKRDSEDRDDNV